MLVFVRNHTRGNKKTNNPRFVWDSYRRLIMMYADVVMEKAEGLTAMAKGSVNSLMTCWTNTSTKRD
jgi:hypothetical protein